jgi:hypothetical protein
MNTERGRTPGRAGADFTEPVKVQLVVCLQNSRSV